MDDVTIPDSIIHNGDTNTKIRFPANDQVSIEIAGTERLNVSASQFKVTTNIGAGDYVSHYNNTSLGVKFYDASGANKYIGLAAEDSGTSVNHATFKVSRQGSAVTRAGIDGSGNFYISSGKLRLTDTIEHSDDSNTKIRFPANDTVSFETAGSERLRITSDGDVIIGSGGVWSYPKPLNVQGSSGLILSLSNFDTTTYAADTFAGIELKLKTGNTGTTDATCEIRGLKENGTNGNSARALTFYTGVNGGANIERLRISSNGDVRVGGGAPATFGSGTTVHETYNSSTYVANLVTSGTHQLQMIASQTHGATSIGTRSNHNLSLTTNDTNRVTITTTGTFLHGSGAIATQKASNGGFDISCNSHSLVIGADSGSG